MPHDETLPAGTHTVEIAIADNHGILRGKRIPASRWKDVRDEGIALSVATLVWGARCELRDDCPVVDSSTGYPDVAVVPIVDSLRPVPWRPGTVQVLGEVRQIDGSPSPLDPRTALTSVLAEYERRGWTAKIALEMEFYLLDPATRQPHFTNVNCYAIHDEGRFEDVLAPMRNQLVEFGVPIEASNTEYSPGQFEVNLRYEEALAAVDNGVRFRSGIKEIAAQHGYLATFMGKPFDGIAGNGMHIHQSVWEGDTNLFRDDAAPHGLTDLGTHYLAGLYAEIRDLSLLGSPTVNDFKRRQDNSFCPTTASWGSDNRTVAIRVVNAGGSTRIEQRDASADCNPYLAAAGQLAAGLRGIDEGLVPPPSCDGDAYAVRDAARLPTSVPEAVDLLRRSATAGTVFPKELLEVFISTCEFEHHEVTAPVTDRERDRYLGVF